MRIVRLVTIACLVAVRVAPAQTPSIPDRLSDTEFRSLMTTLSEPGGIFHMGNTFVSNEGGFSPLVARLTAANATGGAYIGVAPEQNFTYIAAIRPRIAFIIDIRRQASMQHLMYKALFEMSTDRADFLSLLFARPRPAGLDNATSVQGLWTAFWNVRPDTARATATMRRINDRLLRIHGIALDSTDAALLRFVYASFVNFGPAIHDEPNELDASGGYRLAGSWSTNTMSMTVEVRDAVSDQVIPKAPILFGAESNAFGGLLHTDSSGRLQLPPYLVGTTLHIDASRNGYDTARVTHLVIDRARPMLTIRLVRNAQCVPMPVGPGLRGVPAAEICYWQSGRGPGARGGRGAQAQANPPPSAVFPRPPVETNPSRTDVPSPLTYFGTIPNIASITSIPDSAGVPRSFLASEAAFRIVKDLHERNLIIPLVGDFAGPTTIRGVGAYLRAHGTTVTAFYVSNVLGYLVAAHTAQAFFQNAATLPATPSSLVIDFDKPPGAACPLIPWISAGVTATANARVPAICTR